jgi:hypothetical protein
VATQDPIAAAVARLKTPIYLARRTGRGSRPMFSLYTTDSAAPRDLSRRAAAEFGAAGIASDCRVVYTSQRKLRRKSVEALCRSLGSGDIVYDPTGLVARSAAVLACARHIRTSATARLQGLYLDPDRRTLFVIVDQKAFPTGTEALLQKRVAAMGEIARAVHAWRATESPDFELAIRIGFALPTDVAVIPVDQQSLRRVTPFWPRRGVAAVLGSLLGFGALATAQAADIARPPPLRAVVVPQKQPAVAQHNLDFFLAGVHLDGDGFDNFQLGVLGAKGAFPLGQNFGVQVDAAVGTQQYWGIGGHLFWRDPSQGLVGVIASRDSLAGSTFDRVSGEAELYLRNLTLRGEAGAQGGDAPHSLFAGLDLTFYAHPNFSLTGGAKYYNNALRGTVGLEWQPDRMRGLSVFADGDFGSNFVKAVAGVSFHFHSNNVTLIDRDRRYDPVFSLLNFAPKGYSTP